MAYRGLKEDDNSNQAHIPLREEFNNIIRERFRPEILPDDFPDVNLEDMPLHDMYEDNTTYVEGGLAGNTEDKNTPAMDTGLDREFPMPEVNNNYVNSSVMLPRGNSYARWKVIRRKRDADGNTIGRSN